MAKYFHISQGLRGCYMPDFIWCARFETRLDLKAALENEAFDIRDAGFVGLNKRAVASLAANAWREANKPNPSIYPHVGGYGLPGNAHSGLYVSVASRAEYLDSQSNEY